MESHEVPETAGLTADDAGRALAALSADVIGNVEHPYTSGAHPQHQEWLAYAQRLHELRAAGKVEQERQEQDAAIDVCRAGDAAATAALRTEAAAEIERLTELGFDPIPVPDAPQAHTVRAWRLQRLNAEGKTAELSAALADELRGLNAPSATMELLRQYADMENPDPELRERVFAELISWVHGANARRFGPSKVDPDAPAAEQIRALESTPGYFDGTLRRTNLKRHMQIVNALGALYARAARERTGQ